MLLSLASERASLCNRAETAAFSRDRSSMATCASVSTRRWCCATSRAVSCRQTPTASSESDSSVAAAKASKSRARKLMAGFPTPRPRSFSSCRPNRSLPKRDRAS